MEDYKVLRKGDFTDKNIVVVQAPKKLKTRGLDFINIKKTHATIPAIESNTIEETEPEFETPIQEEIEEPEVQEEIKEQIKEQKDDITTFAYSAHKQEDEIDSNAIDRIKDLGDAYKGQPKSEIKPKEEKKSEENVPSDEEFLSALNEESFSHKTKEFKNNNKLEFNSILNALTENKKELEQKISEYNEENEIMSKLQEAKHDYEKIMEGINALPLEFLVGRKDSESMEVFTALEKLFNKCRQGTIDTNQGIKECNERKKTKSEEEQSIRNTGIELTNKKNKFKKDNYSKIVSINEIDKETHKLEESLTEATGIKDIAVNKEPIIGMNSDHSNIFEQARVNNAIPEVNLSMNN